MGLFSALIHNGGFCFLLLMIIHFYYQEGITMSLSRAAIVDH